MRVTQAGLSGDGLTASDGAFVGPGFLQLGLQVSLLFIAFGGWEQ